MVSFKEVFRYAYIDTLLTCSVSLCFCTIKPIYLLPETGSVSKLTIIHSKILMCRLVEWKTNTIGPSHAPTHTVSSCSFAHLHRIHVFGTPDSWEEYLMFLRNSGLNVCLFDVPRRVNLEQWHVIAPYMHVRLCTCLWVTLDTVSMDISVLWNGNINLFQLMIVLPSIDDLAYVPGQFSSFMHVPPHPVSLDNSVRWNAIQRTNITNYQELSWICMYLVFGTPFQIRCIFQPVSTTVSKDNSVLYDKNLAQKS